MTETTTAPVPGAGEASGGAGEGGASDSAASGEEQRKSRSLGWGGPLVGSALLTVTLLTARPHGDLALLWSVFGAATGCWVLWVLLFSRLPRTALVALATSSAVPSVVGTTSGDGTAVIITCITLVTFASRPEPPTPVLLLLAGFDVSMIAASGMLGGRDPSAWLADAGAAVIVVLVGLNRRQHRARTQQAERLLSQERMIHSQQLHAATLDERTRIAREIHDVMAHSLGALRVQLEVIHTLLAEERDVDRAVQYLELSQSLAAKGLDDARDAVAALREEVRPLPDVLSDLVDSFGRDHGTPAWFETRGPHRQLPSAEAIALLRIGREALTNAGKHASGRPVTVELEYGEAEVRLRIRNEVGAEQSSDSARRGGGYGLTGMRERIELVNGTLDAGFVEDGGARCWEVFTRVPV